MRISDWSSDVCSSDLAILYAVIYVGYSIWMDRRGTDNVNHSAHLWGAGYGVLFALVMEPALFPHFLSALANPSFGSCAARRPAAGVRPRPAAPGSRRHAAGSEGARVGEECGVK